MDLDITIALCLIVVIMIAIAAILLSEGQRFQVVNMNVTPSGYEPNEIHVSANKPILWNISVTGLSGCNKEILIKERGIIDLHEGINKFELSPFNAGTVEFTCGMGMMKGEFIVE